MGLDTLQGREREPELFPILLTVPRRHRKRNLAFQKQETGIGKSDID